MSPAANSARQPGFPQGLFLLLPITLAVIGVSVFTATVAQMQSHFRSVPNGDYLVNMLQTMPGFWIAFFSPVAGWLADRFGRRTILLWSMVVYAAAGTAPFWIDGIYPILVTRCLVGMCESIVLTVTTTMLCDYFKGRAREKWLASQTGVASLSALVVIPLGGWLGARFGWQGPFLVYLYSLILFVFVFLFCWEPAKDAPAALSRPGDADARYQNFPWLRMIGIGLITVFGALMFYSTITQNANALVALGVTNPADIGGWATLASFGVPIGTILFWGLGRLNIGLLLSINFLLIGAGFTWMSATRTPMEYVWAANLQQIGCGLMLPTLLVWAAQGLAYKIRGRGNGWWQGAFGLGFFASGMTLEYMGKLLNNSILAAFGMLGKICLVAAVLTIIAKQLWRRRASAAAAGT
jgi:MFS family permease